MNSVPADAENCPNCGYNGRQQNEPDCLPIGYRLNGRYIIGMGTARDGDSVSYIGYDCTLSRTVEIREFLPKGICERSRDTFEVAPAGATALPYKTSLMDFCELYKNLRKIEGNPGIIRTSDFFEANFTAYAVLDMFDGISLREFLSMAGGKISCEQALRLLEPVFGAVESIHAVNLIHRGISPETIFVNRNGDVRLGGFATSQVRTRGTEVQAKLFSGYAAPEQYSTTMWQGTATDVYALAAVYYRCVSGITPQDADQRRGFDTLDPLSAVDANIPQPISRVVSVAMLINSQERTQYAIELISAIKNPGLVPAMAAADTDGQAGRYDDDAGDDDDDEGYEDEEAERPLRQREKGGKKKKGEGYPPWIEKLGIRNFWIIAISLGVVVFAVLGIFVIGAILKPRADTYTVEKPEEEMVTVPDYVGMTIAELTEALDRNNFDYVYIYVFESDENIDKVVRQTPEPGAKVSKMTPIEIYIDKGEKVEVPNVVGMFIEDVTKMFDELGISHTIVYEESAEPPGKVLAQNPTQGSKIDPKAQKVVLTVATRPVQKPPEENEEEEEEDTGVESGDGGSSGDGGGGGSGGEAGGEAGGNTPVP
jgi:serine/threonine-protein kinase